MSELFWLTEEQVERLRPFFPKSHGKPRVDDQRMLSGIVWKIATIVATSLYLAVIEYS